MKLINRTRYVVATKNIANVSYYSLNNRNRIVSISFHHQSQFNSVSILFIHDLLITVDVNICYFVNEIQYSNQIRLLIIRNRLLPIYHTFPSIKIEINIAKVGLINI